MLDQGVEGFGPCRKACRGLWQSNRHSNCPIFHKSRREQIFGLNRFYPGYKLAESLS